MFSRKKPPPTATEVQDMAARAAKLDDGLYNYGPLTAIPYRSKQSESISHKIAKMEMEGTPNDSPEMLTMMAIYKDAVQREAEQAERSARMAKPAHIRNNAFFAAHSMDPLNLLGQRLRRTPGEVLLPFEWYQCYANEQYVYLMYVHNNELYHHRDDAKLYPSDELLAVLKLALATI